MSDLLELVRSKIGCGYVYGAQGEIITKEILTEFIKMYGREHYYLSSGVTAEKWIGKESYDCSGLIVWALNKTGDITGDYTADQLYQKFCIGVEKQDIIPGDLCFKNYKETMVHVGVFAGDNQIVQARGTAYGVVETELDDTFRVFGKLKWTAHWAEEPYQKLKAEGIDIYERRFDENITRGEVFVLLSQIIEK